MNYKQASLKKYKDIRHLIVEIGKGKELKGELRDKLINTICPYCVNFGFNCTNCPLYDNVCGDFTLTYWRLRWMVEGLLSKFDVTKALKWTDQIINAIKEDIENDR